MLRGVEIFIKIRRQTLLMARMKRGASDALVRGAAPRRHPLENRAALPGRTRASSPPPRISLTTITVYNTVCVTYYMANGTQGGLEILENLKLELRRGCLIMAVLAQLRTEQYGYTLRKALADDGLAIDEGTLYPLLRRLETQGLLVSQWREEEKRNKRFYRLSPAGEQILNQLLNEWKNINASLDRILEPAGRP